jgi:hypothetical protein
MTTVTKKQIIDDFISAVMDPARNSSRFHSSNIPVTTRRVWNNGGIIITSERSVINTGVLAGQTTGLDNPNVSEISNATITASEIVDVCRSFARNTTRIRKVQYGLYYTVYSNGQGTQTGVPSDNPVAHAGGAISGTEAGGESLAHLSSSYLVDIPSNISGAPSKDNVINSNNLNSFFNNLRGAADANKNGSSVVDLRICHSSCHNNCHGSRGRR